MNKIEAIKMELCKLRDGESFTAAMTLKEARMAIGGLYADDRDFTLHQDGSQIRVTCHDKKTNMNVSDILKWGSMLLFVGTALAMLPIVFDDSGDAAKERAIYCENVSIWNASGQENGHPNYKNLECGK